MYKVKKHPVKKTTIKNKVVKTKQTNNVKRNGRSHWNACLILLCFWSKCCLFSYFVAVRRQSVCYTWCERVCLFSDALPSSYPIDQYTSSSQLIHSGVCVTLCSQFSGITASFSCFIDASFLCYISVSSDKPTCSDRLVKSERKFSRCQIWEFRNILTCSVKDDCFFFQLKFYCAFFFILI